MVFYIKTSNTVLSAPIIDERDMSKEKFKAGDIVMLKRGADGMSACVRVPYRIGGMEYILGLRDKVQVMWYVGGTRVLVDGDERGFDYPLVIEEDNLELYDDEQQRVFSLGLDVRKGDVTYEETDDGKKVAVHHQLTNYGLKLSIEQEVKRLRIVVEEKNKAIEAFKKYDEERKAYYAKFEQNYAMMEEQYNQFLEDVGEELGDDVRKGVEKMWKSGLKMKQKYEKALNELKRVAKINV